MSPAVLSRGRDTRQERLGPWFLQGLIWLLENMAEYASNISTFVRFSIALEVCLELKRWRYQSPTTRKSWCTSFILPWNYSVRLPYPVHHLFFLLPWRSYKALNLTNELDLIICSWRFNCCSATYSFIVKKWSRSVLSNPVITNYTLLFKFKWKLIKIK